MDKDKLGLIICGSRHFDDYELLRRIVDKALEFYGKGKDVEIISGHCSGADGLGEKYAKEHNLDLSIFRANWSQYGKSAGPIRNKQMIDYIKDFAHNLVIAFVSPTSTGTMNTIQLAKKAGIDVVTCEFEDERCATIFEGIKYNIHVN